MFLPLSSLNDYSRKSKNICLASALPNHLYMTSHGEDKNCLKYSWLTEVKHKCLSGLISQECPRNDFKDLMQLLLGVCSFLQSQEVMVSTCRRFPPRLQMQCHIEKPMDCFLITILHLKATCSVFKALASKLWQWLKSIHYLRRCSLVCRGWCKHGFTERWSLLHRLSDAQPTDNKTSTQFHLWLKLNPSFYFCDGAWQWSPLLTLPPDPSILSIVEKT